MVEVRAGSVVEEGWVVSVMVREKLGGVDVVVGGQWWVVPVVFAMYD